MMTQTNDTRRLTVLHIVQNLNYGGMERLIGELARRADPTRFTSHVLALQYIGRFGRELDGTVKVHLGTKQERWALLRPSRLAAQIREIGPDVVHTHSGVWYKGSLAARLAGVRRVIHTEHGRKVPESWIDRLNDRIAARRTDTVVAVSDALLDYMRTRVVPARTDVRLVRNGVDTALYTPRPADPEVRTELNIGPDRPILGSIGRLEAVKGYDVMVDAFAAMLRDPNAHLRRPPVLVIVGDGSERSALESAARAHGVDEHMRFLGWRDDVARLQSVFALFTMSSRSEGTSVSLLEAMSSALCPVVTDVGGNAAVLGQRLSHRLVPAGRADALAAAWRAALEDSTRLATDGAVARERVIEEFSLSAMVRGYEAIYRCEAVDGASSEAEGPIAASTTS